MGAVGVVVDVAGDGGERGAEGRWGLGLVGGGERDEEPVVDLGVEDGDADAVAGQEIFRCRRILIARVANGLFVAAEWFFEAIEKISGKPETWRRVPGR